MLPKESGELQLIKDNAKPEDGALLSAEPDNFIAGYVKLPIGHYNLKLVRRDAPNAVVQMVEVTMRGDESLTVLASAPDRRLKVEILDETYSIDTAETGRLTIRHFFPGVRVVVSVGSEKNSHELGFGDIEVLDGLPLQSFTVKTTGRLPNGKLESWSTEVNFKELRHTALLIIPDPHGRFRPRAAADGIAAPPQPASTTSSR
jgi:hypothetical protein